MPAMARADSSFRIFTSFLNRMLKISSSSGVLRGGAGSAVSSASSPGGNADDAHHAGGLVLEDVAVEHPVAGIVSNERDLHPLARRYQEIGRASCRERVCQYV